MAGIGEAFLLAHNGTYPYPAIYNETVEEIYKWFIKIGLRDDLNDSLSTVWRRSINPSFIIERHS